MIRLYIQHLKYRLYTGKDVIPTHKYMYMYVFFVSHDSLSCFCVCVCGGGGVIAK